MGKESALAFLDRVTAEPALQERVRSVYATGGDRLIATRELAADLGFDFSVQEFLESLEARYPHPPQSQTDDTELSDGQLEGVAGGALRLSLIYKTTTGVTIAFPDVCKTPAPGGPIPIPYPIISDPTKPRG